MERGGGGMIMRRCTDSQADSVIVIPSTFIKGLVCVVPVLLSSFFVLLL